MAVLLRGIVLKGAGLDVLWWQLLALFVFSQVLYGVSYVVVVASPDGSAGGNSS